MGRIDSGLGAIKIKVALPGSSKVFSRALAADSAIASACSITTTLRTDSKGGRDKN